MQSAFAQDAADDRRPIEEAAAERPGKPILIRVHPTIFREGQYRSWKGVHWKLEVDSPTEAVALREALQVFFQTLTSAGPHAVIDALHVAAAQNYKEPIV